MHLLVKRILIYVLGDSWGGPFFKILSRNFLQCMGLQICEIWDAHSCVFEDSSPHGRLDREDKGFMIFRNVGKRMFWLFISLWQVTPCISLKFSVDIVIENSKNYKIILNFKYSGKCTPHSLSLSLCNVYTVFPGS